MRVVRPLLSGMTFFEGFVGLDERGVGVRGGGVGTNGGAGDGLSEGFDDFLP